MKPCEECPRPGRKVKCCSARLCDVCSELHAHPELLTVDVRAWKKANAPEEDMTPSVIAALKTLPEIAKVWQAKKRGGVRASKTALHVPDVLAYTRNGAKLIGVELKGSHPESCKCDSCEGQRKWGADLVADHGYFVGNIRSAAEALEAVRKVLGGTT